MRSYSVLIMFLVFSELRADDPDALLIKNNAIRTTKHLSKHVLSTELMKAAQDHAAYMAKMHDKGDEDFNHCGANGSPGQRAARYLFEGTVKENLGRGYDSADKVFTAWLNSIDHRNAVLSDTTQVGFGYAVAKDGTTYWVALYGKPK